MRRSKGFTIIEAVVVITIAGILAASFSILLVPQITLFFFLPQQIKAQNTAADLMDILVEGDDLACGLRYAAPLAAGVNAITDATPTSVTYTFFDRGGVGHAVILTYSAATRTIARQVDSLPSQNLPYYAQSGSNIFTEPIETNFFRYYDSAGVEFSPTPATLVNISRINIPLKVILGSGQVKKFEGSMILKSGVEIKHYTG